jgi:hypothetical protein
LQTTARFYDPLGLYTPVSVVGKLLFEDIWCRGINWNELLPSDLGAQWHACVSTLTSSPQVYIPRWLVTSRGIFQVHVFCDVSERAHGVALYIRSTKDDKTLVPLACSKNRLASVKRVTLPWLEFLAAPVRTRLLHCFCTATSYNINQAVLWLDATVALGWIRSDPNRWKTVACNSHGDTNTHESRAVETSGAGQPCWSSLTGTPSRPNTFLGYLVVPTVMTCTAYRRLAIRNSPDESPTPRRKKPSHVLLTPLYLVHFGN